MQPSDGAPLATSSEHDADDLVPLASLCSKRRKHCPPIPKVQGSVRQLLDHHLPKGLRCGDDNAEQIAEALQETWSTAIELKKHIWVLHDSEVPVVVPQLPAHVLQATALQYQPGYRIICWVCGLSHLPSRTRAVMDDTCTVLGVAERKGKQARVSELGAKQPSYAQYLEQLCTAQERKHLHWPRVCDQNEGGPDPGVYLRCIKCGFKVHNSQRYRLLRGRCDDFTQQLTNALISPERSRDKDEQLEPEGTLSDQLSDSAGLQDQGEEDEQPPSGPSTIQQRELHLAGLGPQVLALQEVCAPPSQWGSIKATLRQVQGSVVFRHQRPEDVRWRGQYKGVKLGSGVARLGFHPWQVLPLHDCWPVSPQSQRIRHRLLTALATDGTAQVVCHVAYMNPKKDADEDRAICQEIMQRIIMAPFALYWIAGDFQGPMQAMEFGRALQHAGF